MRFQGVLAGNQESGMMLRSEPYLYRTENTARFAGFTIDKSDWLLRQSIGFTTRNKTNNLI
jgi:hypothetical protein